MNDYRTPNFSAGPATLPTAVLQKAQQEMLNWQNKGVSVMEISHRSSDYIAVAEQAEQDLRDLMEIPDNYKVLFLQGGATLQFSAIPLNLLQGTADYLDTGAWSSKAFKEAQRYEKLGLGKINLVSSSENNGYTSVSDISTWNLSENADYFHYCANETVHGVQIFDVPNLENDTPIIADMSSCILSQKIDVSKFGMIYAGAQKNIGPAGLVIVIIREDLLGKASEWCPNLLKYQTQAQANSMSNTPATYSWYLSGLVFAWLKEQGGLDAIAKQNHYKAKLLYNTIDNSSLYSNCVDARYRSIMNVPFFLNNDKDLSSAVNQEFLRQADKEGLLFLKGHRMLGGMRASIYNAVEVEWVEKLVEFMQDFEKTKA
ncbi:MAG: 3-phosphoserine/phosphohydroxythreonine transaminase [Moraxellaceae bacterium]|nr:3-phosphoserine/phosphohydroxythreonine transaminase [Moraxellaceae bacterium]